MKEMLTLSVYLCVFCVYEWCVYVMVVCVCVMMM